MAAALEKIKEDKKKRATLFGETKSKIDETKKRSESVFEDEVKRIKTEGLGEKPVIFEGNIGNIYVRGDVVSNVDLCRQSRIGRQCLKNECTFRHEPPKKGEIRHYFSAPTYYPPRMDNLAREHKGVHRIGSRENLEDDLKRIRASESAFEYNAYIAQTFHSLLVSLVMERGISS
jgi:hypothetical protein